MMKVLAIFAIVLLAPVAALADTAPCGAPVRLDNPEAARAITQNVDAEIADAPVDAAFINRARARIRALSAQYDVPRAQIVEFYIFQVCQALSAQGTQADTLTQALQRVRQALAEPAARAAAENMSPEARDGSANAASTEASETRTPRAEATPQPSAQVGPAASKTDAISNQTRRETTRVPDRAWNQRNALPSAPAVPRGAISQFGVSGGGASRDIGPGEGSAPNAQINRSPVTTQRMARPRPPSPTSAPEAEPAESAPDAPAIVAAAPAPAAPQASDGACPERGVLGPECFDVDAALDRLRDRPVEYNHPEQMIKGQATEITLVLRTDFTEEGLPEEVSQAFEGLQGEVRQQRARISNIMSARLRGREFEVDPSGTQERTITWRRPVEWSWYVTPNASGEAKRLELELYAHIVNPQGETQPPVLIKTLDATIDVDVRTLDWLMEQARTFEPIYAIAAAIIGLFTALLSLWWRRTPAHHGDGPPSGITTSQSPPQHQRRVTHMSASEAAAEAARSGQDESGNGRA